MPQENIEKLWQEIQANIAKIDSGENIDMQKIDEQAKGFCSIVTSLPAEDAKQYQPRLTELIDNLNRVTKKLTEQREFVMGKIDGKDNMRRAQNAYKNAITNQG